MRLFDRVRETTTTEGTAAFVLLGADAGFRAFGDVLADGEETLYAAALGAQWEVGQGKYVLSSDSLERVRVFSNSSGTEALISFAAGTKKVWIDHPALLDMAASGLMIALSQGVGII